MRDNKYLVVSYGENSLFIYGASLFLCEEGENDTRFGLVKLKNIWDGNKSGYALLCEQKWMCYFPYTEKQRTKDSWNYVIRDPED